MGDIFLKALVDGDSRKIILIYNENYTSVKKFVLQNKGGIADAEDVFQKALLQITVRYKKEKFKINTSFNAYLFTVCKNLWRRELNKSKNKVTNTEIIELVSEDQDNSLAYLELKRQELFVEKLGEISENCKKVLTLFFAKTPYAEIVNSTDYSSETVVRQRVFKCKKKLTELIKKDVKYNSLKEL
ncbi:RNA polymerase subunit sigma [Tenacibaculum sp. Bg11-29]|uniref:RNA polymerase sigma factor n=1 Tax=Tenacibaculum sp. Bg11-29 TaxID=2058306 RepID=UPI000C32A541|nr:sigma-70 family RNA polymerase sigma factor [Tenacibaculum sp. Bg11-29]PKH50682.1 RNA polymerase subunit sigma [Tenacibaculum sp. Bg11-29]